MARRPHLFVLRGDLTRLQVDAIVYPTSVSQDMHGHLTEAMRRAKLGFCRAYLAEGASGRRAMEAPGEAYWVSLEGVGRPEGPFGVVATAVVGSEPEDGPTPEIVATASRSALREAIGALVEVHDRLVLKEAFSRDVAQALRPVARKWRLKGAIQQSFEAAGEGVVGKLKPDEHREQIEQRRLRVGFPALGTGSGYRASVSALELARAQVGAILDALDGRDDALRSRVDVVLVAFNEQSYHNFLKARGEALEAQWRFDEREARFEAIGARPWLQWPVDERAARPKTVALANAIRRGECVLFVGSGLSSGLGMKSWHNLIEALLEDLQQLASERGLALPLMDRASTEDYLDIAQWHALSREKTRSRGHAHYVNRFFGPEATERLPLSIAHYLLMALPFQHVITTNYDDLIERTLEALRRPHARIVLDQDVPRTGRTDEISVVKFHGHAFSPDEQDRGARHEADGTIVLSREEYDTFFHRHPAKALLLEGLLLNHHFFFVGYSLSDPDFRQIQNRVIHMLEGAQRKAFATTLDEDRHWARAQWEDQGLAQIPFHGGVIHDRVHRMWAWLDALSELVTGAPSTFLTSQSIEPTEGLAEVHGALVALGAQIERVWPSLAGLDPEEMGVVERVLDLLQGLGWRSDTDGRSWVEMWRALGNCGDRSLADRVRLLRKALSAAGRSEDIDDLRAELEPLEAALTRSS